mmetsp:Transcript_7234/g.10589  ORF Transcript_7234/g.10589 Transcript_7234/m.10589 type:complete len:1067 (-) Transcript_7234:31-3231(-)
MMGDNVVDRSVSNEEQTTNRILHGDYDAMDGIMLHSIGHNEAEVMDLGLINCPALANKEDECLAEESSEKKDFNGVAEGGLLLIPQVRSSNSEELGSSREEDQSASAVNDSYEEYSFSNNDLTDTEFLSRDDRIQCHDSSFRLLSLPSDSLHYVASFLTAPEWAKFGQTSSYATGICRDVFRKVQIHGFRCAAEVVTAWKMDQHADARELSALYILAGVPIYPYSLGHSYHTLSWRMDVEATELQEQQSRKLEESKEGSNGETDSNTAAPIDEFFSERHSSHQQDGSDIPYTTYLEEKCLHHFTKAAEEDKRYSTRISMSTRANFAPTAASLSPGVNNSWDRREHLLEVRGVNSTDNSNSPALAVPLPVCPSEESRKAPKLKLKIHRHLVDQYAMCRPAVNDESGNMVTKPISLDANFFHRVDKVGSGSTTENLGLNNHKSFCVAPVLLNNSSTLNLDTRIEDLRPADVNGDVSDLVESAAVNDSPFIVEGLSASPPPPPVPTPDEPNTESSILSAFDLLTYNSNSHDCILSTAVNNGTSETLSYLASRFEMYHRRLETILSRNDSSEFEEFMLDFWGEFLPVTASIHFYDGKTAVPRITGLQKFLSKPCPKALGVVQCEIQRIKINQKKKGVNMKGRLFPAYEYQLLIRDCRQKDQPDSPARNKNDIKRRDTILMVGKNKGRKHLDSTGVTVSPISAKKGVNNYFLTLPDQCDVDAHFLTVNSVQKAKLIPNGASLNSVATSDGSSSLLGRLQSNFIGTEFQIFTPTTKKQVTTNVDNLSRTTGAISSDSESDYSSGVLSDNNAGNARRGNRLRIRTSNLLHGSPLNHANRISQPQPIDEDSVESPSKPRRSYSLPTFRKSPRSRRRVVANSADSAKKPQYKTVQYEEENGAITYTANLLGNRPRIMDVCVPKVSDDGVPGIAWKEHLNSANDCNSADSMLTSFKRLQQRGEVNGQQDQNGRSGANVDDNQDQTDDFGLLSLQNRPPWWNAELGAFVLNFGGRVSVASVKNFQLCDRSADQDHIMLQFGRIQGRHSFTMDFQHPLSAVQAFAIAISSLQSRISFG